MQLQKRFGLPVKMGGAPEYTLTFDQQNLPQTGSSKFLSQTTGLLYNPAAAEGQDELSYTFYQNIMRPQDKSLFERFGYTNGITVLLPVTSGATGGECRKNSGHYHGVVEGHRLPYPEAYEVLAGDAVFLLQKSTNFATQQELQVDDMVAVFLKPGEKIVVPPFYAHCAINVGEGPMAFGNLAAPCPLLYEPIQHKHGFGYYVLRVSGHLVFVENPHYQNLPMLRFAKPCENVAMGIEFDRPLYEAFVENPGGFAYLDHPEEYEQQMEDLLMPI